MHAYFFMLKHILSFKAPCKTTLKKVNTAFPVNFATQGHQVFSSNGIIVNLFGGRLSGLTNLCTNMFALNKNIIFIDCNYNYNYLPLTHKGLTKNSKKAIYRYIKYFNIGSALFFDLKSKKSLEDRFIGFGLINISTGVNTRISELNLRIPNVPLFHYIVTMHVHGIYLKIKNKKLKMANVYYHFLMLYASLFSLVFGTLLAYIVYFFSIGSKYQDLIRLDALFSRIKSVLLISLGVSYILFVYFVYSYYLYYTQVTNYLLFNTYCLIPNLHLGRLVFYSEPSIDLFGVIILFLAYFVGILSLLALDNRIF
jgi:hypothetical protein